MRDYAELVKALRHCGNDMECGSCPISTPESTSGDCDLMHMEAAEAIKNLLEEKRLLEASVNLQAKIIQYMETIIRVNGLPTPQREVTEDA